MQHAQAGVARVRRAGPEGEARRRISHRPPEPNPALVQHAPLRAQSVQNGVRRVDAKRQTIADQQWQTEARAPLTSAAARAAGP